MRVICPNGCVDTKWSGDREDVPDCLFCGAERHVAGEGNG